MRQTKQTGFGANVRSQNTGQLQPDEDESDEEPDEDDDEGNEAIDNDDEEEEGDEESDHNFWYAFCSIFYLHHNPKHLHF